jgi:glutamine---fructose-6-phosphate transaminase (isomerizing)
MCGIIAYCGKEPAAPIILEGLRCLEYRGYDSAGIASMCDGKMLVKKDVGKIDEVNRKQDMSSLPGSIAIGHTRWATHGAVTQINAHPHVDCQNRLAVVHNGIIENYQQLRQELIDRGHHFASETDSEVIPHLIGEIMANNSCSLEKAVLATMPLLAGSYAFAVFSPDDPGKIVAARKNNPLVIGLSSHGSYISSDTLAIAGHAQEAISLGDNEVALLLPDRAEFFDAAGNALNKTPRKFDDTWRHNGRDGYEHFMLKEIMEQPHALSRATLQDEKKFNSIALDILRAGQVVFTACGTSRYASLVGRYLFSLVGRKFADVASGSEFGYFIDSLDKNTLVIAVSQSGETADVIGGVQTAREAGAKILSIINRPNSMLEKLSQNTIPLHAGPEIGVAATKTFLCQIAVFYLLSFSLVNAFDEAVKHLGSMSGKIAEVLEYNNSNLIQLAEMLRDKNDFYYIGRGINFSIATEGALKLKEVAYVHAEGMPAGELKHGTLALIEQGTPVAVICPDDYTYNETLSNAMEAKSRGAYIIGVSDRESDIFDYWIKVPRVEEILYPMVTVVPLQLLAYYTALARGYDPDKPRNLAKSVTVK